MKKFSIVLKPSFAVKEFKVTNVGPDGEVLPVPLAVVDNAYYGIDEALPIWGSEDENPLFWLYERAEMTVLCAIREALEAGSITLEQAEDARNFSPRQRN